MPCIFSQLQSTICESDWRKVFEARTGELVFLGQRAGKPLSVMAMEMLLHRMDQEAVTVHGFRSAFRDWAGNETHFPREVAEAAHAHVVGDKAEQAYRRSDALEKRPRRAAWSLNWEKPEAERTDRHHSRSRRNLRRRLCLRRRNC